MIHVFEESRGGFPAWIKWVAGAKVGLLGVFLAVQSGYLHFGEADLHAAGSVDPAGGGSAQGAAPADAGRKSFLDDLLELPTLNRDKLQKEDVARYLSMADRKKKQIDERVMLLGKREKQLQGLEQSIDGKLKRLDEERKFFAQNIQQEKDLKGERLDKLVQLYDKMEPKKAAPVFEKMDDDLVVAMFKRLRQKQVTLILETMSADKSVKLSEYFGRVRSGKEYDLLKEMNSSLRQEFADCKGLPKDGLPVEKESAKSAALGAVDPAAKPAVAPVATPVAAPVAAPAPAPASGSPGL